MMRAGLLASCGILILVGCGGGAIDGPATDGGTGDAAPGCVTGITYMPTSPVALPSTVIRAVSHVSGSDGLHNFTWFLSINGGPNMTPAEALPDNSEVEFPATMDALYKVRFRIEDANCEEAREDIDVNPPGVGEAAFRIHVVAPASEHRPPIDTDVVVQGGAIDTIDNVQLLPATNLPGNVQLSGSPVAAYLKFSPSGNTSAAVEAYSDAAGGFAIEVRNETHQVLVVPTSQSIPPQRVTWTGQTTLDLSAGTTITGVVRDPANAVLPGAKVQLSIDGLPTTLATTDAAGAFLVHAMPSTLGALVHVEVTPPAATGLPRLIAESTTLDVSASVVARYGAGLTTRDLAGTVIQRGAPLANADVTIVGAFAAAGTITAGAAIPASGETRQSAKTNGSGVLPTLRAPAVNNLSAVVFPGAAGDHAVTPIDLTTAVPATITAVAAVNKTTRISNVADTAGLAGAVIDAVPIGALALAGAPTIRKTANGAGQITIGLAPNGTYDLRYSDPNGNRGALRVFPNATLATVVATTPLLDPTKVQGLIIGASPITGAIVQLLCSVCTGLDHDRPIAEGLTGVDGRFSLAVPNPN